MARSQSEACSPVSAASISGSSGPECQPPGSASRMTIAGESSTDTGQMSLSIPMSPSSEGPRLSGSMSLREAFRARISAWRGRVPESPVPARVFGPSTHDSLANFDPVTLSWRTSRLCLDGDSELFSETWPRSGMTRSGIAFRRQPLVPLTRGIASGLLPTPAAHPAGWENLEVVDRDGNPPTHGNQRWYDKKTGRVVQKDLRHVVRLLPTPAARDWKDTGAPSEMKRNSPTLAALALAGELPRRMWPTPRASANENRQTKRTPSQEAGTHGLSLAAEVGGQLNPEWVEWLMGFPLGWTALKPSATPLSRKSLNGSEEES